MNLIITLTAAGVFALLAEILNIKKLVYPVALIGLAVAIYLSISGTPEVVYNMMTLDNFALLFSGTLCFTTFVWFLLGQRYFKDLDHTSDYAALLIFSLIGGVCMVSYNNLTMMFLGIEILSIPLYVLAGTNKGDIRSNESAFKYFLMGAFASCFLLFGVALVFGATGSFDFEGIRAGIDRLSPETKPFIQAGMMLMLAGFGFKIAAVPFHFWAPDVYQGAPTSVTAFMATIVKTAAIGALYRLFAGPFAELYDSWSMAVGGMLVLTVLVGNITAALQDDVKRTLAYSSIAHAGYLLLAILAIRTQDAHAITYYVATYSIASLSVFFILLYVSLPNNLNTSIRVFNGLGKRSPILAALMTLALLSLAGIPPTAGFIGKYMLFVNAVKDGHLWFVLVAVVGSIISVFYYFKIISAMYLKDADDDINEANIPTLQLVVLVVLGVLTILLGLLPTLVTNL